MHKYTERDVCRKYHIAFSFVIQKTPPSHVQHRLFSSVSGDKTTWIKLKKAKSRLVLEKS